MSLEDFVYHLLLFIFTILLGWIIVFFYYVVADRENCKGCLRLFSWSKDAIITYDAMSSPLERRTERHGGKAVDFCKYPKLWRYVCVHCNQENTTRGMFIQTSGWQPVGDPYAVKECNLCGGSGKLTIDYYDAFRTNDRIRCFGCQGREFVKDN